MYYRYVIAFPNDQYLGNDDDTVDGISEAYLFETYEDAEEQTHLIDDWWDIIIMKVKIKEENIIRKTYTVEHFCHLVKGVNYDK